MGLSGRKEKQRISNDPRNLSWADDATKFGQTYLSKFGWNECQGLGTSGSGRTSHIKVSQKLDMLGIGAANQRDPNGIAWKQNKDFENLLRRLNDTSAGEEKQEGGEKKRKRSNSAAHDVDTGKKTKLEPEPEAIVVASKPSISRPMAHRARSRASKNISSKSASAIAEILGIAPTPTPTPTSTSIPPSPPTLTQLDEDPTMGRQTTSTKSVADYFQERLLAKSLGVSIPSTPKPAERGDGDTDTPRAGLGSSNSHPQNTLDKDAQNQGLSRSSPLMSSAFLAAADTQPDTHHANTPDKDDTRKREKKEERKRKAGPEDASAKEKRDKREKKERKAREKIKDPPAESNEAKAARKKARAERRASKADGVGHK